MEGYENCKDENLNENNLENLIGLFAKLPSLGPKSARRIVLYLLNNKNTKMNSLIKVMENVFDSIQKCKNCGNFDTDEYCYICKNENRSSDLICVVESVEDLWAIEKSGIFRGKYHILNGVLSAINGTSPSGLNINSLLEKLSQFKISEVIIATNPTIEGQTTAYYLADLIKKFEIKITRLACGIPIGGDIDHLDENTLSIAFNSRLGFE